MFSESNVIKRESDSSNVRRLLSTDNTNEEQWDMTELMVAEDTKTNPLPLGWELKYTKEGKKF